MRPAADRTRALLANVLTAAFVVLAPGADEEEVPVELLDDGGAAPIAVALKASNVRSADGLTAKTIPCAQWAPCLQ